MLKKKMQEAMCDQINAELASSYLYLAMSAYFESLNLAGFANWMRVQAQEELAHTMKLFDFVNERGGRVSLGAVAEPPQQWDSPLAVFQHTLEHEQQVSERINRLVDLAIKHSDHASNNFLQWFVAEQVEEEASVDAVMQKLKLVGMDGNGLFLIDQELSTRTFQMPAGPGAAPAP